MDKIENENITYWIEDDILHSAFKKATVLTLENTKEMIALRHKISKNKKQYWCSDITNLVSYSKEGRDYADLHGQDFLYASAFIVNSHITMFLFNSFIKIKRPIVPVNAFKSREKAIEWLKEIKKHNEKK